MSQIVRSPREYATSILERAFLTAVNNQEVDEEGVFYVNYRLDEDAGRWIAGRNDSEEGLDYVYRLRYTNETNEPDRVYLYTRDDGWANTGVLLGEREGLIQMFGWVDTWVHEIDKEFQDEVESALEQLDTHVQEQRQDLTLSDVIDSIKAYDFEFLQNEVAPDGEDAVEFWKLLFSYDSTGAPVENENISIPFQDDTLFFARAERQYHSSDGKKEYPMGLVVGYDDTPDTFFVHRIERDDALDTRDFEWTLQKIRERMGFDVDYTDLKTNLIPQDRITRLQGNLAVVPYHFETAEREYYNVLVSEMKQYLHRLYGGLHRDIHGIDVDVKERKEVDSEGWHYAIHHRDSGQLVIIGNPPTDVVKSIQQRLCISEAAVRKEQERRGIQRLSANLRREVVQDLYLEEFCDWLFTEPTSYELQQYQEEYTEQRLYGGFPSIHTARSRVDDESAAMRLYDMAVNFEEPLTRSTVHKIAEQTVKDVFSPSGQENVILGNHSVLANPARIHPWMDAVDVLDRRALEKLIVPQNALVVCGHDEHKSRMYTFPKGVYEFRFLDGLETDRFQ